MSNKNFQDSLEGISIFVRVVEAGSFTQAANDLGHSVSFVSKQVTRLEQRLEVRLLNRSTRSLSLTDIGRAYYDKTRHLLSEAREAELSINALQDRPAGHLKVSLPLSFGQSHLISLVSDFIQCYPQIKLEIDFSSRLVDLAGEGFDVVVRIGESKDSNLICRRFYNFHMKTVATPDYLQIHGYPEHPSELRQHSAIKYIYNQTPVTWEFMDPVNGLINIDIPHIVKTNNLPMALECVRTGAGIGRIPDFLCQPYIDNGELTPILSDYELEPFGVYAVFQHRHYLTAKVRAFVDLLVERFGQA